MRERAINMHETEVRAILAGRKTQTRRVMKPQPFMVLSAADWHSRAMSGVDPYGCRPMGSHVLEEMGATCPHGTVGDRLWVREAWAQIANRAWYRADPPIVDGNTYKGPWKPSIHMPRWASRITLEITGVRVERLQEITPKDAIAEGFMPTRESGLGTSENFRKAAELVGGPYPRGLFAMTWNQINGPESWSANPWVWVVEFKVV